MIATVIIKELNTRIKPVCAYIPYPEVRVRIPYPSTHPYLSTGKESRRGTGWNVDLWCVKATGYGIFLKKWYGYGYGNISCSKHGAYYGKSTGSF